MLNRYKIAIVGLGSIGQRHLRNVTEVLTERGTSCSIDLVRSGKGRNLDREIIQKVNQVYYSNDLVPEDYDIVFITNPTHLHFETIQQFIGKTQHMFIEKPAFDRTDVNLDLLKLRKDCIYYVACPLRYTNVIQYIKNNIDLKSIYCARVICSSYLPEWRPNIDYKNTYSAHKEQGGGVSIDLIHEWDYICYLFGYPNQLYNIKGNFSNLDIDSEDLSIYIARYPQMAVEVHLDYFGRYDTREIQLFMADDTVIGDLLHSEIRFLKTGKILSFKEQRNDFQRKEISNFFDILEGKTINPNDLSTALNTLKIARGEF